VFFIAENRESLAVKAPNCEIVDSPQYLYLIVYHFVLKFASSTVQNKFTAIIFYFKKN
jgi:hypothetical protein